MKVGSDLSYRLDPDPVFFLRIRVRCLLNVGSGLSCRSDPDPFFSDFDPGPDSLESRIWSFLKVGSGSSFFSRRSEPDPVFPGMSEPDPVIPRRSDPGFYTYFHFDSTAPRREEIEKLFCIKYS